MVRVLILALILSPSAFKNLSYVTHAHIQAINTACFHGRTPNYHLDLEGKFGLAGGALLREPQVILGLAWLRSSLNDSSLGRTPAARMDLPAETVAAEEFVSLPDFQVRMRLVMTDPDNPVSESTGLLCHR